MDIKRSRPKRRAAVVTAAVLGVVTSSVGLPLAGGTRADAANPAAMEHPVVRVTKQPLERTGRFFGMGYSDGYHACYGSGFRPGADLPPRSSHASQKPASGYGNTYYDRFDNHNLIHPRNYRVMKRSPNQNCDAVDGCDSVNGHGAVGNSVIDFGPSRLSASAPLPASPRQPVLGQPVSGRPVSEQMLSVESYAMDSVVSDSIAQPITRGSSYAGTTLQRPVLQRPVRPSGFEPRPTALPNPSVTLNHPAAHRLPPVVQKDVSISPARLPSPAQLPAPRKKAEKQPVRLPSTAVKAGRVAAAAPLQSKQPVQVSAPAYAQAVIAKQAGAGSSATVAEAATAIRVAEKPVRVDLHAVPVQLNPFFR